MELNWQTAWVAIVLTAGVIYLAELLAKLVGCILYGKPMMRLIAAARSLKKIGYGDKSYVIVARSPVSKSDRKKWTKMAAKPTPIKLTEEELLRDKRVLDLLERAQGGYHVDSVAGQAFCSQVQANASLKRLIEAGKVELYEGSCHTRLYRVKREKEPFTWGLR